MRARSGLTGRWEGSEVIRGPFSSRRLLDLDARDRTPRPSRATAPHLVDNALTVTRTPSRASGFVLRPEAVARCRQRQRVEMPPFRHSSTSWAATDQSISPTFGSMLDVKDLLDVTSTTSISVNKPNCVPTSTHWHRAENRCVRNSAYVGADGLAFFCEVLFRHCALCRARTPRQRNSTAPNSDKRWRAIGVGKYLDR